MKFLNFLLNVFLKPSKITQVEASLQWSQISTPVLERLCLDFNFGMGLSSYSCEETLGAFIASLGTTNSCGVR